LRIAVKHAANREDASEAVQFAFLAFIDHFDPDVDAPPLAWLTLTLKAGVPGQVPPRALGSPRRA